MAKEEPVFKLPKEVEARLRTQEDEIAKARKMIGVMKELGMDTKEVEEKIDWAAKVRVTLLKEFT